MTTASAIIHEIQSVQNMQIYAELYIKIHARAHTHTRARARARTHTHTHTHTL